MFNYITGLINQTFKIGLDGPILKDNAGVLQASNNNGFSYSNVLVGENNLSEVSSVEQSRINLKFGHSYVQNNTGSTIAPLKVVKLSGDDNADGVPRISTLTSNSDVPFGVTLAMFPTASLAYILRSGRLINALDTSGSSIGAPVYAESSGDLSLSNVGPRIGTVISVGYYGNIEVTIGQNIHKIDEGLKLTNGTLSLDIHDLYQTSYLTSLDEFALYSNSDPYDPYTIPDLRKVTFGDFESNLNLGNLRGKVPITKGGTNSTTPLFNNRFIISVGGEITEASAITPQRVLLSDPAGLPIASIVTEVEIDRLHGITSNVQVQLDTKVKSASNGIKLVDTNVELDINGLYDTSYLNANDQFPLFSNSDPYDPYLGSHNRKVTFQDLESHLKLSNLIGPLSVAKGGTNSTTPLSGNRFIISVNGEITEASALSANRVVLTSSVGLPVASLITETQIDTLSGISGNIQDQLTGKANKGANTDINSIFLDNQGLKVKETTGQFGLILQPGSDLSADRTLSIITGDANRILSITGNSVISGTNTGDNTASDGVKFVGSDIRLDIHGLNVVTFINVNDEIPIYSTADPYLPTDNRKVTFADFQSQININSLDGGPLSIIRGGTNSTTPLSNNRFIISTGGEITEASAMTAGRVLLTDINGLPEASAITEVQLDSLSGISGNIQVLLNAKLSTSLGNNKVWLGNGSNLATEQTPSQVLDVIGSTRGSVLYRGSAGWTILVPSTAGYVLTDGGVGADPSWQASSGGGGSSTFIHGLTNVKSTLSGTTLGLTTQNGSITSSNPMRVAMPLSAASGTLQWLDITTALTMTLPSATFTRSNSMLGFTNTDGVSTLTLSGNAVDVILYWYLIFDTNTTYMGVSRSPFHTQMPPNYWHTPTSTSITAVATDTATVGTSTTSFTIGTGSKAFTTQANLGKQFFADPTRRIRATSNANSANFMEGTVTSYSSTTLTLNIDLTGGSGTLTDWNIGPRSPAWSWDDVIISKTGALTDASSPCMCIGPLCYGTIAGSTGRFSAMALTLNEFPKWNNRINPMMYKAADGTAQNGLFEHEQRADTANGYGSTDTKIRKYTNNTINKGYATQILLAGGASASGNIGGTEYVINEPGDYCFVLTENVNTDSAQMGISVNSVQRTTSTGSVTLASLKVIGWVTTANQSAAMDPTFFCNAGDIVRGHMGGATAGTGYFIFSAKKIGWGQASG